MIMSVHKSNMAMMQIEQRTFQHGGNTFTLKLTATDTQYAVVAYLRDQPVSPSYEVSIQTNVDYFIQHKAHLTENLFQLAQSDLEQGLYFGG